MAYSDNDKKAKLTYLYVYMYLCATLVILYLLQKSIQWPDVIVVVVEGISFSSVWQYLVFERKKIMALILYLNNSGLSALGNIGLTHAIFFVNMRNGIILEKLVKVKYTKNDRVFENLNFNP